MFDFFNKGSSKKSKDGSETKKDLVTLIILDGFGIDRERMGNAVLEAETPFLDTVWTKGKSTLLHASGVHVGLPELEPGNSEVGHLNIGSGQIVYQSLPRINDAISNGKLQENPTLKESLNKAKKEGSDFHLMGILSSGGVHGHIDHLFALLDICKDHGIDPYIHAFLDGRDTGLTDGYFFLSRLSKRMKEIGVGKIASLSGRFYAMDRDKRWERTELAYNAMLGHGKRISIDPFQVIQTAYNNDENDQIFVPTTIVNEEGDPVGVIKNGDVALFYNFREDRARQITKAFVIDEEEFRGFDRVRYLPNLHFVTMTGYEDGLDTEIIFAPKKIEESLATAISNAGKKQLHISETEKYMHVTYFFNGGYEDPHPGEDFVNIASPKVFDYSETPEMSADKTAKELIARMESTDYSFIVINIVNPDMLGHTGELEATVKANEYVDKKTEEIVRATLQKNGAAIIIADHGNCEVMIDHDTGKPHTYHTNNPIPFILVEDRSQVLREQGESVNKVGTGRDVPTSGLLADVAPTILSILDIDPPNEMSGLDLTKVL